MSIPRKIVFNVPSLMKDSGAARAPRGPRGGNPGPETGPAPSRAGEVAKLAMLVEVSQALTGTLNIQAGLYGVLEVLERRCRALRAPSPCWRRPAGCWWWRPRSDIPGCPVGCGIASARG